LFRIILSVFQVMITASECPIDAKPMSSRAKHGTTPIHHTEYHLPATRRGAKQRAAAILWRRNGAQSAAGAAESGVREKQAVLFIRARANVAINAAEA